jgi:hypothetical protein
MMKGRMGLRRVAIIFVVYYLLFVSFPVLCTAQKIQPIRMGEKD